MAEDVEALLSRPDVERRCSRVAGAVALVEHGDEQSVLRREVVAHRRLARADVLSDQAHREPQ